MHSLMTSVINSKQGKGSKELLTGALWFVINPQVVQALTYVDYSVVPSIPFPQFLTDSICS